MGLIYNAFNTLKISSGIIGTRFLLENARKQPVKENSFAFGQYVSVPQGYQGTSKAYIPSFKNSPLIRAVITGRSNLINIGITIPMVMTSTISGEGFLNPNAEVGKTLEATLVGIGNVSGDPRVIVNMASTVDAGVRPSAFDIAQEIWQSQKVAYNAPGTMGSALNSASTGGVDYASLGEAVWNVLLEDMNISGSAGERIKALLTQAKFLALKD